MKTKNVKRSGWGRWRTVRAYLSLWVYARCRQRVRSLWFIPIGMVFGLLIPAMSIYGDTNRTLAEGEEVRSIAELPGNPLDYLATKADLANLEVRFTKEIADLRTEIKAEVADLRAEIRTEVADLRNEIIRRTAGLPTAWQMWSATALILLGLFSLYWQGRTRRQFEK